MQLVPTSIHTPTQVLGTMSVTPDQVAVQLSQQASVSSPSPPDDPSQNQGSIQNQGSTQTQEYLNLPTQSQEYLTGETLSAPSQNVAAAGNDNVDNAFDVEKEKRKRFLQHLRAKAGKSSSSSSSKAKYRPSDAQLLR